MMSALDWLRDSDVTVSLLSRERRARDLVIDAFIEIAAGGSPTRFAVEQKPRAPYPNELTRFAALRSALEPLGHPLMIVPYVPIPLGHALSEAGWSWADDQGNYDIRAPGLRLRQRRTTSPPKPTGRLLPSGSGSWAIFRSLISLNECEVGLPSPTTLARQAGVSQPRA